MYKLVHQFRVSCLIIHSSLLARLTILFLSIPHCVVVVVVMCVFVFACSSLIYSAPSVSSVSFYLFYVPVSLILTIQAFLHFWKNNVWIDKTRRRIPTVTQVFSCTLLLSILWYVCVRALECALFVMPHGYRTNNRCMYKISDASSRGSRKATNELSMPYFYFRKLKRIGWSKQCPSIGNI